MENDNLLAVRDVVITKLKSDGIFDDFRKSCVNSIENEPLFRAQKEEVEVISRRFLQRGHWDDKTMKSDVRGHLRGYVLDVLHRPEAINQLGFIAEKILSRKHKEFMAQITNVTNSLQDDFPIASNCRDEHISYDESGREPVKATETAVDLLQSFAISTPSSVSKKAPAKPVKTPARPSLVGMDGVAMAKVDPATMKVEETPSKVVENDEVVAMVTTERELRPLKHHRFVLSSSEESDDNVDKVLSSPVTTFSDTFTTKLLNELYPSNEELEVKWSPIVPVVTNTPELMEHYKYSCFIHPAAPWVRCRPLHQQLNTNSNEVYQKRLREVMNTDHDMKGVAPNDEEPLARQSARLRKRRNESENPSSDSDTELTVDPESNEQVVIPSTGTRTSKRVRRAPIKLRL